MGTRPQGAASPKGNRKAPTPQGLGESDDTHPVVDPSITAAPAEPVPQPRIAPVTVDGEACSSLYALVIPPAHVVTPDAGTHEVTRVYYDYPVQGGGRGPDKVFELGHGHNKVAGRAILSVDVVRGQDMVIRLYGGLRVVIPADRLQLTYTV